MKTTIYKNGIKLNCPVCQKEIKATTFSISPELFCGMKIKADTYCECGAEFVVSWRTHEVENIGG